MPDLKETVLEGLNDPQREAVCCLEGPLLVLAGPGTGKTRVITRRIANLMAHGADQREILGVTFTNKAAGEMRSRVQALVGGASPLLCTFHSFCARLLRIEGRSIGLNPEFTIYDEDDSIGVLKQVAAAMNLDDKRYTPQRLRHRISRLKNRGIAPDKAPASSFDDRIVQEAYAEYQKALRRSHAVDFDDLLLRAADLLREDGSVREKYQDRYRHVLVDEYQDTNACQYEIMKTIGGKHRNVCATGDPDQSIYGWRGADLRNILDFERDYPNSRVVRLEQNYRSTQSILGAASGVIRHNRKRKEKDVWTQNPQGGPVRLVVLADDTLEAYEVGATIDRWVRGGRKAGDVAVFYRTNAQSRPIETALVQSAIPYHIVGGTAFYERREIRDVLAYLRCLANPRDDEAVRRIINVPRRSIGEKVVAALDAEARKAGMGLAEIAFNEQAWPAALSLRQRAAMRSFAELIGGLKPFTQGPVRNLIRETLDRTGYVASLDKQADADRVQNIEELVNAAAQFDSENPDAGLTRYLEEVALLTGVDRWEDAADRVTLMTLHMAKGLEFPVVMITGVEDGLLPLRRSDDEGDDESRIEEERRLFFVGMTRAKEELVLTRAKMRRRFGDYQPSAPSTFVGEIPSARLHVDDRATPSWAESRGLSTLWDEDGGHRGARAGLPPADAGHARPESPSGWGEENQESPFDFEAGDRVSHGKFGAGVIESVTGGGLSAKAVVRFRSVGRKVLLLSMARLKRL